MATRKLVFLVTHPSAGGAQELWANLAEEFRARGHDVRLMALYPLHDRVQREAPAGMTWHWLVPRRPTIGIARLLFRLVRTLRLLQADIVFTATPFVNVLAPIAARMAGVDTRIVTSHHSPAFTHGHNLNRIDSIIGGWANVQAIVSVSEGVRASLATKPDAYRAKCLTIHNALPPRIEALIDTLAPTGPRQPSGARRLIATGRLSAQKNYETLLKAVRRLPDVTLDIIGSGPLDQALGALAQELGIVGRVRFLGQQSRDETLRHLAGADLFVQPSLFEGHSLALIEAARLKLPLIVSTADTQVEAITAPDGERCGVMAETMDDAALAHAIGTILDDPAGYAQWSTQAGHLAASISYSRMIDAYAAVVERRAASFSA